MIYLLTEDMGLGYHVLSTWDTENKAKAEMVRLQHLHDIDRWGGPRKMYIKPYQVQ